MVKANHALSNSAQNYKMEELVNSSNPQKFWSTVKNLSTKSVNSQDLSVPVGKLYTNFQNLHSQPDSGQYSEIQLIITIIYSG